MQNWKKIALGVAALALCWHVIIAMTPRISLAGPFLAKPADPGYVWTNADHAEARFFGQSLATKWLIGATHPEFQAEAAQQEGDWNPMPGYAFVNKSQSLNTVWKQSLKHPDYMAWSDEMEGKWIPVTGYKFIYEGDTFVDSVWNPNQRYDDVKVISLAEKDHYKPFPGYSFTEPGQSLKVVWMPGIVNPDNSRLIAGTPEGSWIVNTGSISRSQYTRRGNNRGRDARLFLGGVATGVLLRSL